MHSFIPSFKITILVAVEGIDKLPIMNNNGDLKNALQNHASIPSSRTMVIAKANSTWLVDKSGRRQLCRKWLTLKVYPEGTHFMIPWVERPVIYDVRARPNLVESTSGSRDLQMVRIGLRVLTCPVADQLPTIYRSLCQNYNERVLPSIIHETLKAVVAQYNASQLLTQREAVSGEIRKVLTQRAKSFNIALDDVSITTLTFGKEFTAAIEAKQVAAQEAERAKFVVEKAEQDKRSDVIKAQANCAWRRRRWRGVAAHAAYDYEPTTSTPTV